MPVRELLARTDSRELSEWQAYAQIEPFGDLRADLRAGIVAATVANTARDRKKRRQPFKPEEFMPKFDRETAAQSPQHIREFARMMAAAGYGSFNDDHTG